jgi:hypothetical protein
MAAQLKLVWHRTLWEIHIKTISSGTSSSIRTKLWWNSHWMVLIQNCVRQSDSPTKMAVTVQLRCYWKQLWSRWAITGSWEPLVLGCFYQSQKEKWVWTINFMWISHRVLCQTNLSCAAILVRGRDHQTQFWKRTIQWLFYPSLVPIQKLSNWFQTRRFLCEFPIGSYVKLSSAVGAILVEGPNRRWSPSKIVSGISDLRPRWPPQPNLI